MTPTNPELENFILWFLSVEDIPLQIRRDFTAHLLKKKYFDPQALVFMDEVMELLVADAKSTADELQRRYLSIVQMLEAEQNPEISLEADILRQAKQDMMETATNFKEDLYAYQQEKAHSAESTESTEDQAEVEALKAGLLS